MRTKTGKGIFGPVTFWACAAFVAILLPPVVGASVLILFAWPAFATARLLERLREYRRAGFEAEAEEPHFDTRYYWLSEILSDELYVDEAKPFLRRARRLSAITLTGLVACLAIGFLVGTGVL